jgi:hypothetical protein
VREAVGTQIPVRFKGRMGGIIPLPEEIEKEVHLILEGTSSLLLQKENSNGRFVRQ